MGDFSWNVIFLVDDYLPRSTRSHAKMMHELAKYFVQNGHNVTVLTPGDPRQSNILDLEQLEGVSIWRFRSHNFRGKTKVWRAINEMVLPLRAYLALSLSKERLTQNFDLCVSYSPTIFFGPLARHFKKRGAFVYLILRDFFPQWAVDQGLLKNRSVITSFFKFVERLNYRCSDVIGVQSEANIKVFHSIYPRHANVQVLMNWSEQIQNVPIDTEFGALRRRVPVAREKVLFFYGGNIGHAQDMMNIVRLASDLATDERAHFILVGQGDEFDLVKMEIRHKSLDNLTLFPSVSQEEYRKYVVDADVGLFSLSRKHTAHNFPGKVFGYMAASLPILGSVNPGNDILKVITGADAGLVSINGDFLQLLADAKFLINNPSARVNMGNNSLKLLKNSFSVDNAYNNIVSSYCGAAQPQELVKI